MKNILKVSLTLILLVTFTQIQAQTYRLEAGYIQPNRTSDVLSKRYFHGIRLGGTVDFTMPRPINFLGIHTGLLYTFAFSNDVQKYALGESIRFETQGNYLDIPLHITGAYEFNYGIKAFIFAGPNLNIGLYQPQKVTSTLTDAFYLNMLSDADISLQGKDLHKGDLRRINFQLEAGGGIQWQKLMLKGGYAFGINDLSKKTIDKQKQGGWYVSFAYEL